jgi:probable rRNA maturation factor
MDITIKNLQTKIPIRLSRIKKIAEQAFQYLGMSDVDLSIAFVSASEMKRLNAQHLKHDYVTDILTFNYRSSPKQPLEAEIIICPAVALKNAREFGDSLDNEVRLYVIHGILHLAGYDDQCEKDIKKIRLKESEIIDYLEQNKKSLRSNT